MSENLYVGILIVTLIITIIADIKLVQYLGKPKDKKPPIFLDIDDTVYTNNQSTKGKIGK